MAICTVFLLFLAGCDGKLFPSKSVQPVASSFAPLPNPLSRNTGFITDEPLVIYFSKHDHFGPNDRSTWDRTDLFVGNDYSFEVQLLIKNFGQTPFSIEQNNAALTIVAARTNQVGGSTANRKPRLTPDASSTTYSVDIEGPAATSIFVLTMSPPTNPVAPTHGQVFQYDLVVKGTGTYSSDVKRTSIKAIYIEKGRCKTNPMVVTPTSTVAVGTPGSAAYEVIDCKKMSLIASGANGFSQELTSWKTSLPSDGVSSSKAFTISQDYFTSTPKAEMTIKINVSDAMGRPEAKPKSEKITIDPCTIVPASRLCPEPELDCRKTRADGTRDPRCQCAGTDDNIRGEFKSFQVHRYCQNITLAEIVWISGCDLASALRMPENKAPMGCYYSEITGTPIGDCASGAPKRDIEMCIMCKETPTSTEKPEKLVARNVCTLDDAKKIIPVNCEFKKEGSCQ